MLFTANKLSQKICSHRLICCKKQIYYLLGGSSTMYCCLLTKYGNIWTQNVNPNKIRLFFVRAYSLWKAWGYLSTRRAVLCTATSSRGDDTHIVFQVPSNFGSISSVSTGSQMDILQCITSEQHYWERLGVSGISSTSLLSSVKSTLPLGFVTSSSPRSLEST